MKASGTTSHFIIIIIIISIMSIVIIIIIIIIIITIITIIITITISISISIIIIIIIIIIINARAMLITARHQPHHYCCRSRSKHQQSPSTLPRTTIAPVSNSSARALLTKFTATKSQLFSSLHAELPSSFGNP
jgi:ABC-type transport system involved in cytochrome bd biosynthesis fused ATPase/permease subunit